MPGDSLRRWINNESPTFLLIAKLVGIVLLIGVGMFIQHYRESYRSLDVCGRERQECQSNYTVLKDLHSSLASETTERNRTITCQSEKIADMHLKHLEIEGELKLNDKETKQLREANSNLTAENNELKIAITYLNETVTDMRSKQSEMEQQLKRKEEEIKELQTANSSLAIENGKLKEKLDNSPLGYVGFGAIFAILVLICTGCLTAAVAKK